MVNDELAVEHDGAVPQGQVEVATAEATGDLVGTGRVEEVAGEGPQLGAVRLALVVDRERFPAGAGVHAPTDVAGGVGLGLTERREVAGEQVGVEAVAVDRGDAVVLDHEPDRGLHVLLEGEVHVAGCEHEGAVDGVGGREREHEPAGPVGDVAGLTV